MNRIHTARKPVGSGSLGRPSFDYSPPVGQLRSSPYINTAHKPAEDSSSHSTLNVSNGADSTKSLSTQTHSPTSANQNSIRRPSATSSTTTATATTTATPSTSVTSAAPANSAAASTASIPHLNVTHSAPAPAGHLGSSQSSTSQSSTSGSTPRPHSNHSQTSDEFFDTISQPKQSELPPTSEQAKEGQQFAEQYPEQYQYDYDQYTKYAQQYQQQYAQQYAQQQYAQQQYAHQYAQQYAQQYPQYAQQYQNHADPQYAHYADQYAQYYSQEQYDQFLRYQAQQHNSTTSLPQDPHSQDSQEQKPILDKSSSQESLNQQKQTLPQKPDEQKLAQEEKPLPLSPNQSKQQQQQQQQQQQLPQEENRNDSYQAQQSSPQHPYEYPQPSLSHESFVSSNPSSYGRSSSSLSTVPPLRTAPQSSEQPPATTSPFSPSAGPRNSSKNAPMSLYTNMSTPSVLDPLEPRKSTASTDSDGFSDMMSPSSKSNMPLASPISTFSSNAPSTHSAGINSPGVLSPSVNSPSAHIPVPQTTNSNTHAASTRAPSTRTSSSGKVPVLPRSSESKMRDVQRQGSVKSAKSNRSVRSNSAAQAARTEKSVASPAVSAKASSIHTYSGAESDGKEDENYGIGVGSSYVQKLRNEATETHISKVPAFLPLGLQRSANSNKAIKVKPEILRRAMDIRYKQLPRRMLETEIDDDEQEQEDEQQHRTRPPSLYTNSSGALAPQVSNYSESHSIPRPSSPVESIVEQPGKIKLFVANPDDEDDD